MKAKNSGKSTRFVSQKVEFLQGFYCIKVEL